ncbi:MAG TPA: hypothetical protein DCX89_03940 [Saprospirales bacterium]|nr:hypothetical protein [Saprospirales bacterium]HRQ29623.1 RES family NAD+ phosphorylase [Saprospiraceae bacterium]
MNCCTECFSSNYLKDIINRNNTIGDCDFCGTKKVSIYNPAELSLIFQNILDLYSVHPDSINSIETQIEIDFQNKIFSEKIGLNTKLLLQNIVKDDYGAYQSLFENNVVLTCSNLPESIDIIKPLQISWEKFADEIKTTNRFHIQNTLDLEKLQELLIRYKKPINKGKKFYRARISTKEGFVKSDMLNPPADKAKAGRANPTGISYLYLADQIKTTLYEARASLFDYVTVGEFRAKEDIKVINLRGDTYDPVLLAEQEELEDFLIHLPFITTLETNLSKPRRRSDNELDYLPTQYLSEFIKSIGFDGVEFQSSLFSGGYNLAIFTPDKFECISVNVFEIENIDLKEKKCKP